LFPTRLVFQGPEAYGLSIAKEKWIMRRMGIAVFAGCMAASAFAEDAPLLLKPSKDNFARSNYQIRNNGGSENLYIAHAPNLRVLIAFDLSEVTNEIVQAEFRFRQQESNPKPLSIVVAPMVATTNNAAWGEGSGNLGARGQNARLGDSCYAFSAYRDVPWESASGKKLKNLAASSLWKSPVATLGGIEWKQEWVDVAIDNAAWLEQIRKSDTPTVTFGIWGTSGNGLYSIASKESQWPPELHLVLKEEPKK
jgi:hypothetical protein